MFVKVQQTKFKKNSFYPSSMSDVPSDFYVRVIARGNFPTTPERTITIKANGTCLYTYRRTRYRADTTDEFNFKIPKHSVEIIYYQFLLSDFFNLQSKASKIVDGDRVEILATMDNKTHEVKLINYKNKNVNEIVEMINSLLPFDYRMEYNALTSLEEI